MVWYSLICVISGERTTPHQPLGCFLSSSSACTADTASLRLVHAAVLACAHMSLFRAAGSPLSETV